MVKQIGNAIHDVNAVEIYIYLGEQDNLDEDEEEVNLIARAQTCSAVRSSNNRALLMLKTLTDP